MLIFVVARTRLDRYEELRRQFADGRDVRIILDRREGERRAPPHSTLAGVDRRRTERRRLNTSNASYVNPDWCYGNLGWCVVETEESGSASRDT
jgi:hypothetical protein